MVLNTRFKHLCGATTAQRVPLTDMLLGWQRDTNAADAAAFAAAAAGDTARTKTDDASSNADTAAVHGGATLRVGENKDGSGKEGCFDSFGFDVDSPSDVSIDNSDQSDNDTISPHDKPRTLTLPRRTVSARVTINRAAESARFRAASFGPRTSLRGQGRNSATTGQTLKAAAAERAAGRSAKPLIMLHRRYRKCV